MPKVGGKKFSYTVAGRAAAARARRESRSGAAMRQAGAPKQRSAKKRMAPKGRKPGNAR